MSLSAIPVELLELVMKHCEAPQICSFRLSCRRISEVADEHFLQSTTLFFVRDDFDTIEKIIQHNPRVANTLSHVTFQTDHLRPLHEYGSWKRLRDLSKVTIENSIDFRDEARLQPFEKSLGRSTSRPPLDPAFDHYTRQWYDQESLYQEKRAYTCFQKLFTLCSKLDSIRIATGLDHGRPQSWKIVEAFRKGIVGPKCPDYHGYVNGDLTKAVTRAAKNTGKSLKSLTVEPVSSTYFHTAGAFDIASVLHCLESLRLNNICEERRRGRRQSQENGEKSREGAETEAEAENREGIAKFLFHTPNLRSLDITCSGPRVPALHSIIDESTTWPHLRTLALTNVEFTAQNCATLLLRHRATLEILKLCDVVFAAGNADDDADDDDADLRTCLAPVAGQLMSNKLRVVEFRGRLVAECAGGRLQILQFREGNDNAALMERYILEGGQLPTHQLAMHGSS